MKLESRFYTVDDVIAMLGCTKSTAYKVIKELNEIWTQRGKLAVRGKVNKTIFNEFYPGE